MRMGTTVTCCAVPTRTRLRYYRQYFHRHENLKYLVPALPSAQKRLRMCELPGVIGEMHSTETVGKMNGQAAIGLAILKANWDHMGHDYLENFVPLVAECIRLTCPDVVSIPDIRHCLSEKFGLEIPQNSINLILKRVRKRGYIRRQNRAYVPVQDKLNELNFKQVQSEVLGKHEGFLRELIRFAEERYGETWSESEAESAFGVLLDESQEGMLRATRSGQSFKSDPQQEQSSKYIVATYIEHLQVTHSVHFEHLDTLVKGNMLANALFLTEPGTIERKFRNTEIYFDTSWLIYSLGYTGQVRMEPCLELLELLMDSGAKLRCFAHTLEEARGILLACARRLARSDLKTAYGPSVEYFVTRGYTASDIEIMANRLDKDLAKLGIRVQDKPQYQKHAFVIDETALVQHLRDNLSYSNPHAAVHDADSIAAIIRLREGRASHIVEECKAIFVTTNSKLDWLARTYSDTSTGTDTVPPTMTDDRLTTLLWLKRPLQAPDLPRKRIIADCYAAMQPSDHLWQHYLTEIERINKEGTLSSDDYLLLRYSLEARSALMETTLGDEDTFTQGTIPEILEIVKSEIRAEEIEKLRTEQDRRKDAEARVEKIKQFEATRRRNIRCRAERYSVIIIKVVRPLVILLLFVGAMMALPLDLPPIRSSIVRYLFTALLFLMAAASFLNLVWGTTINSFLERARGIIADWLEQRILALDE